MSFFSAIGKAFKVVFKAIGKVLSAIWRVFEKVFKIIGDVVDFIEHMVSGIASVIAKSIGYIVVLIILIIFIIYLPVVGEIIAEGVIATLVAAGWAGAAQLTIGQLTVLLIVAAMGFAAVGMVLDKDAFIAGVKSASKVVGKAVKGVLEAIGYVIGAIGSAAASSLPWWLIAAGGFLVYKYITGSSETEDKVIIQDHAGSTFTHGEVN